MQSDSQKNEITELQNTTAAVKRLLKIYYDIPKMIDLELATIRHCEEECRNITLPSVNLSGMPGGKGTHGDRTAAQATSSTLHIYDDDIKACSKRISDLKEWRDWTRAALDNLDITEQEILRLAYMGNPNPRERKKRHRFPGWKQIADTIDYSESQTRAKAAHALMQMVDLYPQTALRGMGR